ncbi:MAG: hypothetical protein WD069_05250 [Planctomycetales bacterium]
MDVAHLILYFVAAFLALRSLISLMAAHKRQVQEELLAREMRERQAARRRKTQQRDADRHAA